MNNNIKHSTSSEPETLAQPRQYAFIASADLSCLQKSSPEEAQVILGNANTRLFMRRESVDN